MSNDRGRSTDEELQAAVERIAQTDLHLKGSRPKKWILVVESEWDEATTLSVFRSEGQPPWDSLGLLRFAALQEELRTGEDIDEIDG